MHGCETLLVAMSTTHHECQDRAREQLISACTRIQSHAKQRITTSKVNEASDLSPWLCYGVHAKLQESLRRKNQDYDQLCKLSAGKNQGHYGDQTIAMLCSTGAKRMLCSNAEVARGAARLFLGHFVSFIFARPFSLAIFYC